MLAVGSTAPLFTAESTQGRISLADYHGQKNVILIFYPKDETRICTAQLCAVQESYSFYEKYDTIVFGVNQGDVASHEKFSQKHGYQFPLIHDEGGEIRKRYEVGKILGLFAQQRIVYVINKEGKVIYAQKGNPPSAELLAVVKA